ncbi:addiction module toxin RelE [Pseudorhodoferax soli]
MYYTLRGTTLIVVLAGGDKASQARDIERAKAMVLELPDGQSQDPPV